MAVEGEDWLTGSNVPVEPSEVTQRLEEFATSPPIADDLLTRLWQGAEERQSGADAVEALRVRKRTEIEAVSKRRCLWRRG